MIHNELKTLGHIFLGLGLLVAALLLLIALVAEPPAPPRWWFILSALSAAGGGYFWSVWLRSHAQRGEDLEAIRDLLRAQERQRRSQERERQHEFRAIQHTPPTAQVEPPPPPTPTGEKAAGNDDVPAGTHHEAVVRRAPMQGNRRVCGACGHKLYLARIGDACPNCHAVFTSEQTV